jgi:hypothetical protein
VGGAEEGQRQSGGDIRLTAVRPRPKTITVVRMPR